MTKQKVQQFLLLTVKLRYCKCRCFAKWGTFFDGIRGLEMGIELRLTLIASSGFLNGEYGDS